MKKIRFGACGDCSTWSIRLQDNGRPVRHSIGFGSVEKVGPGTRHPMFKTKICTGHLKKAQEKAS